MVKVIMKARLRNSSRKPGVSGIMTLAADRTGRIYGNASDGWGNVPMDINGILV